MAKMSEATKAKLIELRKRKMVRANLKSLEQTLGLVALDAVQEQIDDHVLPPARLTYRECAVGQPLVKVERRANSDAGFTLNVLPLTFRAHGGAMGDACTWVHLKHCPDWLTTAMAERFGKRIVTKVSYRGPADPRHVDNLALLPLAVVFAFMRFVWPDPLDFGERVEKYVVGYTDEFVDRYPGVGAVIEATTGLGTRERLTVTVVGETNWRPWKVRRETGETFVFPQIWPYKNVG